MYVHFYVKIYIPIQWELRKIIIKKVNKSQQNWQYKYQDEPLIC